MKIINKHSLKGVCALFKRKTFIHNNIIHMSYLIYKITNIKNDKIYIGKTKEYYGDQYFGIDGRLRQHMVNAFTNSKKNDCPRFYNAIRKYGKESFVIELLEATDENNVNTSEKFYIDLFGSTDDDIGYNISLGGDGRSVVNVNEDIREKISKAQFNGSDDSKNMLNIKPYIDKNNNHTGYVARRRENGKVFQKMFAKKKYSLEENLTLAKQWIEIIKNNKTDTALKYNKSNDLPQNIGHIRDKVDKNLIIGYRVDILINGIKFMKSFQNKNGDMNELLDRAIKYRDSILNNAKL
jgi:group I intron endonuclease